MLKEHLVAFLMCLSFTKCNEIKYCGEENGKGYCFTVTINSYDCFNVDNKHWISSIDTKGNCFRLFDRRNCEGKSVFAAPGSWSTEKFRGQFADIKLYFDNRIASISSHCFSEDICYAIEDVAEDIISLGEDENPNWVCKWADKELNIGYLTSLSRDTDCVQPPVVYYQSDESTGRVEYMEAVIKSHHLAIGTDANGRARKFAAAMGRSTDIAGQILPRDLGGSGTDMRNIFPQSPGDTGLKLKIVENVVKNLLGLYNSSKFSVNLVYDTEYDTRPVLIVYRIYRGEDEVVYQDSIANH